MPARVLRDPLLHFLLIGVLAFAAYYAVNSDEIPGDSDIVVSMAQQNQLAAAFARTRQRSPQATELKGLIDDFVREEIANREAMALGLDRNDPVVRRRLRQKYESLMQQIIAQTEPTESELATWYAAGAERYLANARYTLRHAFFSSDRREDPAGDARRLLAAMDTAQLQIPAADSIALPERFDNASSGEIAARLGEDFSAALGDVQPRRWSGPIASAYGQHLVFVEAREESALPELDDVRQRVLQDWRAEQLRTARARLYEELLERYRVRIEN